jgi:hypothetical protein
MALSLDRTRSDTLPKQQVIDELRRVATHYGNRRFSRREFDKVATGCKGSTVLKNFDNDWQKALDAVGPLKPHQADRSQISSEELLTELGRIWGKLGHRPSKTEWDLSEARFSYTTYKARFKGWINACAAFIEFSSGGSASEPSEAEQIEKTADVSAGNSVIPAEKKRTVPLKLRLKVLQRDNFRCVLCGKSPATHLGTSLHLDHIIPYSEGGPTSLENLRTLCEECNWGKGKDRRKGSDSFPGGFSACQDGETTPDPLTGAGQLAKIEAAAQPGITPSNPNAPSEGTP